MAFLFLYFLVIWLCTLRAESSSHANIIGKSSFLSRSSLLLLLRFMDLRSVKLSSACMSMLVRRDLDTCGFSVFPISLSILLLDLTLMDEGVTLLLITLLDGIQEKESVHPIIINLESSVFFFLAGTKKSSIFFCVVSLVLHPFLFRDSLRLKVCFFLLFRNSKPKQKSSFVYFAVR